MSVLGELVRPARGPIGIRFDVIGNIWAEVELGSPYEAKSFNLIFKKILM